MTRSLQKLEISQFFMTGPLLKIRNSEFFWSSTIPNFRRSDILYFVRLESNGSVAEWSKALDLGSSLSGGVGSNPTAIILFAKFIFKQIDV